MPTAGSDARRQAAVLALAVVGVLALAATLHAVGRSARRVRPDHRVVSVHDGAEALEVLRREGVRGRAVLWLDRDLPVADVPEASVAAFLRDPASALADDDNFLYLAMRANLVRRVVYLVPEDRWGGFAAAARSRPELHAHGRGFVQFVAGVPIVSASEREGLASLDGERAIVYLSRGTREFFGDGLPDRLIGDPAASDLVLVRP